MRGANERAGRMSYRRLAGAVTGVGSFGVAAIFLLSSVASAGIAHPAVFPAGTWWTPSTYRSNSGCAQAHAFPAHWSALTGAGKMHGSASAKTCPAYRGGNAVTSSGYVDQSLEVYVPISPAAGPGGANVTWSLKMIASEKAVVTSAGACPGTWYNGSYFYPYSGGYYYNFTDFFAYCSVSSEFEVEAWADLFNGSSYMASGFWYMFNSTSQYNDTYNYSYSYQYLNSSYWAYNYSNSYAGSYNSTYGGPASFSGTVTPTFFLNGTFYAGNSYHVLTGVSAFQDNYLAVYTGSAVSSVNMGGTANHCNLLPVAVW